MNEGLSSEVLKQSLWLCASIGICNFVQLWIQNPVLNLLMHLLFCIIWQNLELNILVLILVNYFLNVCSKYYEDFKYIELCWKNVFGAFCMSDAWWTHVADAQAYSTTRQFFFAKLWICSFFVITTFNFVPDVY
jgi:hypothetical protein